MPGPPAPAPRALIIAPSGWPQDPARYQRGLERLRQAGFEVLGADRGLRRASRYAGSEDERALDLNALCGPDTPMPDLVLLPRGGYGAIHLLDRIDYARLCPRLLQAGTVVMGYSDYTALSMALLAKGKVINWSGPMVCTDLGVDRPDPAMADGLRRGLTSPELELRVDAPQTDSGSAEGTFWGGNLATLVSLVGTPYLPDIRGGLLFLEDDAEPPYRVDRLLFQLYHAGILGRQKAILLGAFTSVPEDTTDACYTLETVVADLRARLGGIPVFTGLPVGHIPGLQAVPVGGHGRVAGGPGGYALTLTGHPCLGRVPARWWDPGWTAPAER